MSINLEISQVAVEVGSRGQSVTVDLAKLTHDILRQLLSHGIVQKIGDSASSAKAQAIAAKFGDEPNKADAKAWAESDAGEKAIGEQAKLLMDKALDALYAGKWAIREGTGTSIKMTDEQSLAIDIAKDALKAIFTKATQAKGIKATAENFLTLGDKVSAFFNTSGKRPVWNDKAVLDWIAKQAEADKADYMAQAREEIARRAKLTQDIDLGDMLADL